MKNTKLYALGIAALAALALGGCAGGGSTSVSVEAPSAPVLTYAGVTYGEVSSSSGALGAPTYKFTWEAVEGASIYTFYHYIPAEGETAASYVSIIETPALEYSFTYDKTNAKTLPVPLAYDSAFGDYSQSFVLTAGNYVSDVGKVESPYSEVAQIPYKYDEVADSTGYAAVTSFPTDVIAKEFPLAEAWGAGEVVGYAPKAYDAWTSSKGTAMPAWAGMTSTSYYEAHFGYSYSEAEGSSEASESNATVLVLAPGEDTSVTSAMNIAYGFMFSGWSYLGAYESGTVWQFAIPLSNAGAMVFVQYIDVASYNAIQTDDTKKITTITTGFSFVFDLEVSA